MKQFINAASGSVGAFLVLLALFPASAVAQTVVVQTQSYPQVQVYSQPQAYPQVQRYQQVQNYPQVQNYARTQAYPQLATPQQAVVANSVAKCRLRNPSITRSNSPMIDG